MNRNALRILGIFTLIALSGCAISKHIVPVNTGVAIDKIYVLRNDRVHMAGCNDEIVDQLRELGFQSELYTGDLPEGAKYYLTFTANWNWDFAMYLTYFRATLYEEGKVLGEVEYDSKLGGMNFDKFGPTEGKIRPLLTQLLANVERVKP